MRLFFSYTALVLAICLCAPVQSVQASPKTFNREYRYQASEADSKLSCRSIALEEVKRILLEELGTYLVSKTSVKNLALTKDEVTTLTAGIVRTDIKEELWDGITYYIKVEVVADPEEVAKTVSALIEDMDVLEELEEAKSRADNAMKQVELLRMELDQARENPKLAELERKYNEAMKKESSSEAHNAKSEEETKRLEKELAKARESSGVSNMKKRYSVAVNELAATDLFERGHSFLVAGDHIAAIAALSEAVALNPKFARAYAIRGAAYLRLEKPRDAIVDFTRALEIDPDLVKVHVGLGVAYRMLNVTTKSLTELNTAIKKNPEMAEAYFQRAITNKELGWRKDARRDLTEAARLGHAKAREMLKKERRH